MQYDFLMKAIDAHKYPSRRQDTSQRFWTCPFILWNSCPRASLQSGLCPAPVGIQIGLCVSSSLMDLSPWDCYITGAKWRL